MHILVRWFLHIVIIIIIIITKAAGLKTNKGVNLMISERFLFGSTIPWPVGINDRFSADRGQAAFSRPDANRHSTKSIQLHR